MYITASFVHRERRLQLVPERAVSADVFVRPVLVYGYGNVQTQQRYQLSSRWWCDYVPSRPALVLDHHELRRDDRILR